MVKEIIWVLILYTLYLIMGGLIFSKLEHGRTENPILGKDKTSGTGSTIQQHEEVESTTALTNITSTTVEHMLQVVEAERENRADVDPTWTLYNSIFFALTLITTIGYGNMAPNDPFSQIFCMAYAMFGIPLNIVVLKMIGVRFGYCLEKIVSISILKNASNLSLAFQSLKFFIPWFVIFLILPSFLFMYTESWTFLQGVYYCFITLSTVGFGDYVAGNVKQKYMILYKTAVLFWLIFGLAYIAMILNYIARLFLIRFSDAMANKQTKQFRSALKELENEVDIIKNEVSDYEEKSQRRKSSVGVVTPSSSATEDMTQDNSDSEQLHRIKEMLQNLKATARQSAYHLHIISEENLPPPEETAGSESDEEYKNKTPFDFLKDV